MKNSHKKMWKKWKYNFTTKKKTNKIKIFTFSNSVIINDNNLVEWQIKILIFFNFLLEIDLKIKSHIIVRG